MKSILRVAATIVLIVMLMSFAAAFATSSDYIPIDPFHEASDYFKPTYVWDGDLGDESIPMALLCCLAVVVAVSAVAIHKKRRKVR